VRASIASVSRIRTAAYDRFLALLQLFDDPVFAVRTVAGMAIDRVDIASRQATRMPCCHRA